MKKKVLMYRWEGQTEWKEYPEGDPDKIMETENYEVGRIYTVEYKVIEVDKK